MKINYLFFAAALLFSIFLTTAHADDYYLFIDWPVGAGHITGVNGYIDHHGNIEGIPGAEYLFFTGGSSGSGNQTAYVYRVETDGDPNMHPNNPYDPGPIAPRTFTFVNSYSMGSYSGHKHNFYIDDTGIYYGAYNFNGGGVCHWDFDWNYLGRVVQTAPPTSPETVETLAYNKRTGDWWVGNRDRDLYRWNGSSWVFQFRHPSLGGNHHDGMVVIGNYLYVSDMTSDIIWQYELDSLGNVVDPPNSPHGQFSYSASPPVEGMGYGPNEHIWIAGYDSGTIYEIGGGILQCEISYIPDFCISRNDRGSFPQFDLNDYIPEYCEYTFESSGAVQCSVELSGTYNNIVVVSYEDDWIGTETITFTGTEPDSVTTSSRDVSFTVCIEPTVLDIPKIYWPFQPFDLDDYLDPASGADPEDVSWSAYNMTYLDIDIDSITHITTITNPGGSDEIENITFTAYTTACCSSSSEVIVYPFGSWEPYITLSPAPPFADTTTFHPAYGDTSTLFEFRINYQDSSGHWPQAGYPCVLLDIYGDESVIDTIPMLLSEADSTAAAIDGIDFSAFTTLSACENLQIRFEALDSIGIDVYYPESDWLDGPIVAGVNSTDLRIYANDITFSGYPHMPDAGEEVEFYGRIHNNSPIPYNEVKVYLTVDSVFADSFFIDLPARDMDNTPGYADIAFDTVFYDTAFHEIRITVDPYDEITEWNEYNNSAVRALFTGGYVPDGEIVMDIYPLGSYYPMTYIGVNGLAWYEEHGADRGPVTGARVEFRLIEEDRHLGTAFTSDNGGINFAFQAPIDTGSYQLEIIITDFTLTDTMTVPFRVKPYPDWGDPWYPRGPNLVIGYSLSGFPLDDSNNTELTISNPIVYNIGNKSSNPSIAAIIHKDDTLTYDVPLLDAGESHLLTSENIIVNHSSSGHYSVIGKADYDHDVSELWEFDNTHTRTYYVWCSPADLRPINIVASGVAYKSLPMTISAHVGNYGSAAANSFDLMLTDSSWAGIDTVWTLTGLSLSGYGANNWFTGNVFAFSDTGMHKLFVTADPYHYVDECSEDNNVYSRQIYIGLPKAELNIDYSRLIVDNPDAVEGEPVHFQALVNNSGDSSAYNFDVHFVLDGNDYTSSPDVNVEVLEKGTTDTITHPTPWQVDFTKSPFEVYVDYGNVIREVYEGNNYAGMSLPYDFHTYYRSACPDWPGPHFFDRCSAYIYDPVVIHIRVLNSGLFNFNDSLQIVLIDSLAGASSSEVIDSLDLYDSYLNHNSDVVTYDYPHSFAEPGIHYVTMKINPTQAVAEYNYSNNNVTYSIEIRIKKPDLEIRSEWMDIHPLNPDIDDYFCIRNVDVYNFGDTTAYNIDIKFEIDSVMLGEIVTIDSIPNYGPNNYYPVQPTDSLLIENDGMLVARAFADPFDSIAENDETNNSASRTAFAGSSCYYPELIISEIYYDPDNCPRVGDMVDIVVVVENDGCLEFNSIVSFSYFSYTDSGWTDTIFIAADTTGTIGIGVIDTFSFAWEVASDSTEIYIEFTAFDLDYYPDGWDSSIVDTSVFYCERETYTYLPGDANMLLGLWPPYAIGNDMIYLLKYFEGKCPPHNCPCDIGGFWPSADVNGNCMIEGGDITYYINYFKGVHDFIRYCPDYPPSWLTTVEAEADGMPIGWPNCEIPILVKEKVLSPK